jgi:branched-subunit amino acid transport protein
MDQTTTFLTILAMGAVSMGLKLAPVVLLPGRKLPRWIDISLRHLPVAVLSAMTIQLLAIVENEISLGFGNLALWAAIPTVICAALTRSLFWTIAFGMSLVVALRWAFS